MIAAILLTAAAAHASPGAIFDANANYLALIAGTRAGRVGDIVSVVLVERTDASTGNATGTQRNGSMGLSPPTTGPLALLRASDLSLGGSNRFQGQGTSTQSHELSGEVAARVVEVLPGGLLRVEGVKRVRINRGDETLRVAGLVRASDIDAFNRIPSTRIANGEIGFTGRGEVARAGRQGWLQRFLSIISPF